MVSDMRMRVAIAPNINPAIIRAMTKQEVIEFFGGVHATARALGISQPSVTNWRQIPAIRQLQIERLTDGRLRAGPECDPYRVPTLPEGNVQKVAA